MPPNNHPYGLEDVILYPKYFFFDSLRFIAMLLSDTIRFGFDSKGRHQKKKMVFFRKTPKGGEGGLAESKISLSEKTEIFLEFFLQRGGVSPIPKGCYHKKMGIFGYFRHKGGSHPIQRDFVIKN